MNSDPNHFFTVTASATVDGLGTFDFGAHEDDSGSPHWMHPSYRRYVGRQFGSSSTTIGTYAYNPNPPYIDFVFDLTGANQYVSGFRQMTHKDIIWHVREYQPGHFQYMTTAAEYACVRVSDDGVTWVGVGV